MQLCFLSGPLLHLMTFLDKGVCHASVGRLIRASAAAPHPHPIPGGSTQHPIRAPSSAPHPRGPRGPRGHTQTQTQTQTQELLWRLRCCSQVLNARAPPWETWVRPTQAHYLQQHHYGQGSEWCPCSITHAAHKGVPPPCCSVFSGLLAHSVPECVTT